MAEEKRSFGGEYRGDCPGEVRIVCEKTIFPVWQIIGWIFSVSVSVVIVIVVCSALITKQISTCSINAQNGQANDNIVCATITQIVTNVTLSETNINAIAIAIVNLLRGDLPPIEIRNPDGTLGDNPFGMFNTGGEFPLALGGDRVLIEIEDSAKRVGRATYESTRPGCAVPVIGIEVDSDDRDEDDRVLGQRDGKARTKKTKWREQDLDLPPFCDNLGAGDQAFWSLLGQPRVHHTRTYIKGRKWKCVNCRIEGGYPQKDLPGPATEEDTAAKKRAHPDDVLEDDGYYQTGAPYAVFTARQYGNPNLLKLFLLYVDFVTERPTLIEIPFESLDGRKSIINSDGTVHLINNIKLDSVNHEITFQVGSGVRELTIAGYDFGPGSTDTAVLDVRNRDASGSFVACLTPDGGIYRVFRIDRDARLGIGPGLGKRKCEIYR